MHPPIDLSTLSVAVARVLDLKAPAALRTMAARGVAPGLKPHDALTVVALMAQDDADPLVEVARATLDAIPERLLDAALVADLPAGVLAVVAPKFAKNTAVMLKILALPQLETSTVAALAARASEAVAELIAINEERMLADSTIIEQLYLNKATRMSTCDRIIEFAVRSGKELTGIAAFHEVAAAIAGELIAEPSDEPGFDDVLFVEAEAIATEVEAGVSNDETHVIDEETGEEKLVEKLKPVKLKLTDMNVSQKVRRAMLGTPSERAILVRDNNKIVAAAAIKSPMIQENEVVRIAGSRNVSEDVLSVIVRSREWMRTYQVKLNLVQNPRVPFTQVAKLIPLLRESDLKTLAGSKNVSGAVSLAARQHLQRKTK